MHNDPTAPRRLSAVPAHPAPTEAAAADYQIGPHVSITFTDELPSGTGWWDPRHQTMHIDATLRGRDLAVTLLHELGHMLCGDHDDVLDDDEHRMLEQWAEHSASLLDLVRPGRRAVPA